MSPIKKRLVVCCDGTWQNSDEGTKRGDGSILSSILGLGGMTLQQPSNVTRLCRSVKTSATAADDSEPVMQVSYYQSGIGTQNPEDEAAGGLTGEGEAGLAEHIREAYAFVAANYDATAGDEIVLVGFSRGAFTARSIAAFVNDVGLLTPKGMSFFYPIFEDWENQLKPGYKPSFPDFPFPGPRKSMYPDPSEYAGKLADKGFTRPGVRIKAVAVYDTVGSLGVPRLNFWKQVSEPHRSIDFAFVDTGVPACVDHAIHAIALDEIRAPFAPTLWEKPGPGQSLTQVWFCGAHADVGGAYDETAPANITLAWMVAQLAPYVEFDGNVLQDQYAHPPPKEKRDWACGVLNNEYADSFKAFGFTYRTPGDYLRYKHETGEPIQPPQRLENTGEKIHSSVRIRLGLPGRAPRHGGAEDAGVYATPALLGHDNIKAWKIRGMPSPAPRTGGMSVAEINRLQKGIQWWRDGDAVVMPEDLIGENEWQLLKALSPQIADNFFGYVPKN